MRHNVQVGNYCFGYKVFFFVNFNGDKYVLTTFC